MKNNLKIISLKADNFKRLTSIFIEPGSGITRISGRNEAGKSSTLDAIWAALGGTGASPEMPIREGAESASVRLDLGDIIVTRKWTSKGNYLEVTDAEGAPYSSPQKVLDRLYGKFTFDPATFLAEKDQRTALLQVIDLAPDWAAFKAASGMAAADPAEIKDPLRYIGDVRKTVYEKRRDQNRDAKLAGDRVTAARGNVPDGIDLEQLEAFSGIETLLEERKQATTASDAVNRVTADYEANRQATARLEDEIAAMREQIKTLTAQISQKVQIIRENDVDADRLRADIERITALLPDIEDIDRRIADASRMASAKAALNALKVTETEYAAAAKAAADTDAKLTAIDTFTTDLLNDVKMPVPGLGITDDGITLNEIPFSQCSHAQRLKTATAIGMAANPKLRIIRISDGEKFDSESWAILEQMATENDFQIWVEQMDESGQIGVFIEDGSVKANNYATDAEPGAATEPEPTPEATIETPPTVEQHDLFD
jgi:hypothetical protein